MNKYYLTKRLFLDLSEDIAMTIDDDDSEKYGLGADQGAILNIFYTDSENVMLAQYDAKEEAEKELKNIATKKMEYDKYRQDELQKGIIKLKEKNNENVEIIDKNDLTSGTKSKDKDIL